MRISDQAINRLNVLKAIRKWGPVSRTELPNLTGLSTGSVSQLTGELRDRALIVERKETDRRPGRPRTYLEINADGGMVIGANLAGAGRLNAAFIDLLGNRLQTQELRIGQQPSLAAMAGAIGIALADAIASSGYRKADIVRVGMAMPALVDSNAGNVHSMTTFPVAEPIPFAVPISNVLGLPVTIENDVTCMARAEYWFGRAKELETFTLIHIGFTIGSAEYIDGLPRTGGRGLNPEFGHVKSIVDDSARSCFCGGRGCLASYASMFGILDAADALKEIPFPPTTSIPMIFDRFVAEAEAKDGDARAALDLAAKHLGLAIANLINATDPGNVLILFANEGYLNAIVGPMTDVLRANVMPGILPATSIELRATDTEWRWKGAAALALEKAYLGGG